MNHRLRNICFFCRERLLQVSGQDIDFHGQVSQGDGTFISISECHASCLRASPFLFELGRYFRSSYCEGKYRLVKEDENAFLTKSQENYIFYDYKGQQIRFTSQIWKSQRNGFMTIKSGIMEEVSAKDSELFKEKMTMLAFYRLFGLENRLLRSTYFNGFFQPSHDFLNRDNDYIVTGDLIYETPTDMIYKYMPL